MDLLLAAAGLVPLVFLVLRARRGQKLALYGAAGFVLVALISALTSQAPNIGIFGLYDWGTGWLLWLSAAGAFAIGCRLRSSDQGWLFGGLLAGALVNSAVALYQTLALPTSSTFGPYQANQADGLLGNPIFLESLLLGVIALVSVRAVRSDVRSRAFLAWFACLALMGVALEFSEERAAVGLLAVLFLTLVVVYRGKGLAVAAPTGLGYLAGYLGAGHSLGARIAAGTSSIGFHQRIDLWKIAAAAVLHRPLLGFGPGQLEAATNPRMSLALAQSLQPGKIFTDSHDIVIEVAVTTGVIGLCLFVAWVGGSVLRARNSFVFFALMCLGVELVEPLNIAITPLLFLALGASLVEEGDRGPRVESPFGVLGRLAISVLCAGGLFLGGAMLVGDAALGHAPPHSYSLAASNRANSLLFYWPESSNALTEYYRYEAAASHRALVRDRYLSLALRMSWQTARRLPPDPLVWVNLGDSQVALRHFRAASAAYHAALRDDRWAAAAFDGLAQIDLEQHSFSRAAAWYRKELRVLPPGGERTAVEQHLADAKRGIVPRNGL